jgi:hypothetical protein
MQCLKLLSPSAVTGLALVASMVAAPAAPLPQTAVAQSIPSPEAHFGHRIGADRKLVSWSGIVEYLNIVGDASDRVNVRVVGPTTHERPFLLLEISSPETIADLDRYKKLQQRLYFQDHRPGQDPETVHTDAQRQELFDEHKAVVLITATIHATEVGAAQMSMELVHHLATANDPQTQKILDDAIFLLVPSLNPDGQAMVADWYNLYAGTEYEAGRIPWLYHPYVGHDNNRDMYMFSQQETRRIGEVLYQEWFPSIWLDEHQMGSSGPRIFVMPATDPINSNVHPLIYRLAGFYGQSQGAALEAAGKVGIIYDYVYTNFWPGAMAWTGWWHNQVGMLTEMASVQIATPTDQHMAPLGLSPTGPRRFGFGGQQPDTLPRPRDTQPRTNYPRPWLGGHWTLRDIVDYELIVSLALLETAASTRRRLIEQIYEVNRTTIAEFLQGEGGGAGKRVAAGNGGNGGYPSLPEAIGRERSESGRVMAGFGGAEATPYAIVIPPTQHDPATTGKMLEVLQLGGVIVERATAPFEAGGEQYAAGTHVIRLAQVFGRYAKEMLETQTYPEVRLAPGLPPLPPYDVTAWSLGLQMGVESQFVSQPFEAGLEVVERAAPTGTITGSGGTYLVDAAFNDAFAVANRLWTSGARIRRTTAPFVGGRDRERFAAGTWVIDRVSGGQGQMQELANEFGLTIQAAGAPSVGMVSARKPRIALYQPWGSNMDEGWTRWLLEHYGFDYTTLHPQDIRAAAGADDEEIDAEFRAQWPPSVADHAPAQVVAEPLRNRFDVILFTHENANGILSGSDAQSTPPVYRGGIGDEGLAAVWDFVQGGGTVVALGAATGLFIEQWPVPVRNVSEDLETDEFLIPGSIVNIETDPSHALAWGMPSESHGYFIRSPFFALTEGFASQNVSVPVRYPNTELAASGWLRGGEHLAGRAAAVQIDFAPGNGRLVLLGLRPQHRVQTHATFKLLFNALVRGR